MIERALRCDEVEAHDLAAKYAAGRLDASSVATFEEHMLLCSNCQELVRIAVSVRRADSDAGIRRASPAPRFGARRVLLAGAAVVVLGAGIVVATQRAHESAMRRLGVLDAAPMYQGLAVRAATSPSDSAFVGAMNDYAAGSYRSAADRLERLTARGEGGEPASFFLGASLLVLDRAAPARDAFARVIDAAPSPYSAEARYYRARAELQLGDADAAIADLRAVPAGDPVFDRAQRLLGTVEGQRSR